MSDVTYTDPRDVTGVRTDDQAPTYGRNVDGYGSKIPTRHSVKLGNRWRRVYVMNYGNAGTAYVIVGGQMQVLDIDTQYRLEN
jgi:hypothetical protein